MVFAMSQSYKDLFLMEAIRDYLNNLGALGETSFKEPPHKPPLMAKLPVGENPLDTVNLVVSNIRFLSEKIIPLFSEMN